MLRNLIDEAVQDPSGNRSFFYVGDVKQSIFAWRGGDPRLFREIFDHYNAARPGVIAEAHLVKSYRSGPPVIEAVNRVFGAAAVISRLFPGEAAAAWNREWRAHESARPERGGHVALLHAADEDERFATALRLLREIQPLARGLSCALLVQDNAAAAALADFLRREGGLPAVAESDLHVCTDHPLGAGLLALVKAAAHPGDTLAQAHVRMTPLGRLLEADGLATREALTRRILGQIHTEGFERTVDTWLRRLEPSLRVDDRFSRQRARQFAAAAGLFDATGSREVAEFVQFMERHTVRDSDTADAVRVMTVHKAKGLDFDVVILPDLEGTKLDERREGLAVRRAANREVEWILDLPTKPFYEQDDQLMAQVRSDEANACYENLSLLYVAMTRAKQAMYVIAKPPGKSTSRNFPKLLAETLGEASQTLRVGALELAGAYQAGDPDWHQRGTPPSPTAAAAVAISPVGPEAGAGSRRLPSRRPSAGKGAELPGSLLFALEGSEASDFGTAVHELLAQVEWLDAAGLAEFGAAWEKRGAAGREAMACLRASSLAEVWTRPESAQAEVWREREFEVVLDDTWVTGVFDRVVVERDATGRVRRVTVFDFKTDRVAGGQEVAAVTARHAAQLNLYRRVVALLTGIDAAAVGCELVLTRLRQRAMVPLATGGK